MQVKDSDVEEIATYQTPTPTAIFKGRAVKLLAAGNAQGHSPVIQYIDQDGTLGWAEQDDFVIFDPTYLPCSNDALVQALRGLKGTR